MKAVRLHLFVVLLSATAGANWPATASEKAAVWVTGIGEVFVETLDLPTAREQALARARQDAIVAAAGEERFVTLDMLYRAESDDGYDELFSKLIKKEVSGLIVAEHPPEYRFEEVANGILKVVCTLGARVAVAKGDRDPGFQVAAEFVGNASAVFRSGDEMVLRIQSTRDCYVTVFGMASDGDVTVLYPNPQMAGIRLRSGEPLVVPDERQRTSQGIRFVVELPEGRDTVQESIHVVATRSDVPFQSLVRASSDLGRIETYQATYTAVNQWLIAIAPSERTSCFCLYTVVR